MKDSTLECGKFIGLEIVNYRGEVTSSTIINLSHILYIDTMMVDFGNEKKALTRVHTTAKEIIVKQTLEQIIFLIKVSDGKVYQQFMVNRWNPHLMDIVEDWGLSIRTANCLSNSNIKYAWQIVTKDPQQLMKIKNFGRKSLNEVQSLLEERGMQLNMNLTGFNPNKLMEESCQN